MTFLGGGAQRRFFVKIDLEKQMKTLLQEAEVYKSQGLLSEAKAAFGSVAQLIQENEQFAHKTGLLEEVLKGPVSCLSEVTNKAVSQAVEPQEVEEEEAEGEELLEISLLEIPLEYGTQIGKRVDIEVAAQAGSKIRVLISQQDKELMGHLRVGFRINDVRFYAPFATFKGAAFVTARNRINSGTKKGNCVVDMKIEAG